MSFEQQEQERRRRKPAGEKAAIILLGIIAGVALIPLCIWAVALRLIKGEPL